MLLKCCSGFPSIEFTPPSLKWYFFPMPLARSSLKTNLILTLGHPSAISVTISGASLLKMFPLGFYITAVKIQPFLAILLTKYSSKCSLLALCNCSNFLVLSCPIISICILAAKVIYVYCDPFSLATFSCILFSTKDKLFSLSRSFIA